MNDLLIPRYKVVGDYPDSQYRVGEIIDLADVDQFNRAGQEDWLNKYPDIFRKMGWWVGRSVHEMPVYVKWDNINEPDYTLVMKPEYYEHAPYLWDGLLSDGTPYQFIAYEFLPATEEEYNAYNETQATHTK